MRENSSTFHRPLVSNIDHRKIKIVVCTWNLHGDVPPVNYLKTLIDSLVDDQFGSFTPDILIMATQECEHSLGVSMICQDKTQWENMLRECAINYKIVETNQLVGIHTAILVKQNQIDNYITRKKSKLRAGRCNILGNKGAISIVFNFQGQDLQVINCHLAPHQTGNQRRNQILLKIAQEMVERDYRKQVILCGDLNYRIEMDKEKYFERVANVKNTQQHMQYFKMLKDDQLKNQAIIQKQFLPFYHEAEINFPPTYKIGATHDEYHKERIPGWTDRIFTRKGRIQQHSYTSKEDIYGSDHRPVVGIYSLQSQQGLTIIDEELHFKSNDSLCQLI